MIGNDNCKLILDVLKNSCVPLKISEICTILKHGGHNITHDMIVNYFWGEKYRLVEKMEKIHPYKYKLKPRKIKIVGGGGK